MLAQSDSKKTSNELCEYLKYSESYTTKTNNDLISTAVVTQNDIAPVLYLNPSRRIFTIHFDNTIPQSNICVYDAWGKCVKDEVTLKKNIIDIDLRSQPKGIYLVEIVSGDETAMTKIVLQ